MTIFNNLLGLLFLPLTLLVLIALRLVKGRVWCARVFAGVDLSGVEGVTHKKEGQNDG